MERILVTINEVRPSAMRKLGSSILENHFKDEDEVDLDLDLDVFDSRCLSIKIPFLEIFQNSTAPFDVLVVFQLKGPNTQQQCAIGIWSFVYVCSEQQHSFLVYVCQRDGSQYDPYFHH